MHRSISSDCGRSGNGVAGYRLVLARSADRELHRRPADVQGRAVEQKEDILADLPARVAGSGRRTIDLWRAGP